MVRCLNEAACRQGLITNKQTNKHPRCESDNTENIVLAGSEIKMGERFSRFGGDNRSIFPAQVKATRKTSRPFYFTSREHNNNNRKVFSSFFLSKFIEL
jgi:hypothetical protein